MSSVMRTVVPATVAAALLTVGAGSALAKKPSSVSCGQVITHSIHLRNNLIDCPGPGLVIGADHIRVNLGGHLVDGINNPAEDLTLGSRRRAPRARRSRRPGRG